MNQLRNKRLERGVESDAKLPREHRWMLCWINDPVALITNRQCNTAQVLYGHLYLLLPSRVTFRCVYSCCFFLSTLRFSFYSYSTTSHLPAVWPFSFQQSGFKIESAEKKHKQTRLCSSNSSSSTSSSHTSSSVGQNLSFAIMKTFLPIYICLDDADGTPCASERGNRWERWAPED